MWDWVKGNLEIVVPVLLPVAFLLVNGIGKRLFGKQDFSDLGADLAWGGCTVFAATLFRQLLKGAFVDQRDIPTAGVFACIFLVAWGVCLALGYKKLPAPTFSKTGQVTLARIIGCIVFWASLKLALFVGG